MSGAVREVFFHYPAYEKFPAKKPLEDVLLDIQRYHMDTNGWTDIAYSHAVFPDGQVFELRGWGVVGGHTYGHNSTSYALLFMVTIDGPVTDAMVDGARAWLREGEALGHISRSARIQGHKDVRPTLCPGENVMEVVEQLDEEDWWATAPPVTPELHQAYLDLLGREPTEYAQVWQEKINLGEVTLTEVKFFLVGVRLGELEDLIPDELGPPEPQDEDEIDPESEPVKKAAKKATKKAAKKATTKSKDKE